MFYAQLFSCTMGADQFRKWLGHDLIKHVQLHMRDGDAEAGGVLADHIKVRGTVYMINGGNSVRVTIETEVLMAVYEEAVRAELKNDPDLGSIMGISEAVWKEITGRRCPVRVLEHVLGEIRWQKDAVLETAKRAMEHLAPTCPEKHAEELAWDLLSWVQYIYGRAEKDDAAQAVSDLQADPRIPIPD